MLTLLRESVFIIYSIIIFVSISYYLQIAIYIYIYKYVCVCVLIISSDAHLCKKVVNYIEINRNKY